MYIAICDDRAPEREVLAGLVAQWQQLRQAAVRIQVFSGATQLLDAAREQPFSLFLLDVMMPGLSGLDAARELRSFNTNADIVFLTASPEFAYESYGVHALDYLLKPIRSEALFPILDRLLLQEQQPQDGLTLKCGSTLTRVLFSQLTFVEICGKHLHFNLTDGSVRQGSGTLREFEPILLARPEFVRVHRSYIANLLQAAELSPAGIRTFSGRNIPISRLLYPQVQKDYMALLFPQQKE